MAAVSTAALTPPSSSHGRSTGGDWNFSVPIDGTDTPDPTLREHHPNTSMLHRSAADGQTSNELPNVQHTKNVVPMATITPTTPNVYSPQQEHQYSLGDENYHAYSAIQASDYNRSASPEYLAAPRAPMLQRQDSTISSNNDGDSVFDLYGGRLSTVSGVSVGSYGPKSSGEDGPPSFVNGNDGPAADEVEADSSNWIHSDKLAEIEAVDSGSGIKAKGKDEADTSRWIDRDKLAKIENRELQQAGIRSRASSGGTYIREENESFRDGKKQRVASPSSMEDRSDQLYDPEAFSFDFRTPEEQAADNTPVQAMPTRQFRRHPSYSRIPVPTSSPCPIPQGYIERSTPLLRNSLTPNGSEDDRASLSGTYHRARKRSHSAGSAFLLDDQEAATPTPGPLSNPKNPSRSPMSPGNRRTSRTSSQLRKDRTRSNPQLHNRPGTSASHATHTGSAGSQASGGKHHPEGPPPWSLQSYKPDPSLPPDQQIIPTVAKRMQQEQWERDGAYASVYDRKLRPLKVPSDPNLDKEKGKTGEMDEPEWPLKSPTLQPEPPVEKPKSDAGYKTVPTVSANLLLYFLLLMLVWGIWEGKIVL
ncbi:hypothetical protein L873DRAFT_1830069 [Choiromyces venosus 120613-1]|uniref:Uncharacterized protein n=1 Tax=Choiromyces venosus 120613-1 TaxID=1336337 RepID=A0A3N4JEW9_9PEZI|nr:hypothetical protein L873DRAFT_1830069 [Choiromyces venosus 120613-1]